MRATLFVSDLHLQESRRDLTEIFLRFLRTTARAAQGVYILGDLFESWIGDDDDSALALEIQHALRDLTASGTPCGFLHGNRDFLVGEHFAAATGVTLLNDDECVIDLYGTPTLLLHGDTLCTGDTKYQEWRVLNHTPAWQTGFLAQPLAARLAFAANARQQSNAHMQTVTQDITDVAPEAVEAAFRRHDVTRMIHGHTHRPDLHALVVDGKPRERWVIADWREHGEMLVAEPAGLRRESLR